LAVPQQRNYICSIHWWLLWPRAVRLVEAWIILRHGNYVRQRDLARCDGRRLEFASTEGLSCTGDAVGGAEATSADNLACLIPAPDQFLALSLFCS